MTQLNFLTAANVTKSICKAADPDNITGCVFYDCVEELKDVLKNIFNTFLSQAVVPTCLSAYQPVTLTSTINEFL